MNQFVQYSNESIQISGSYSIFLKIPTVGDKTTLLDSLFIIIIIIMEKTEAGLKGLCIREIKTI